jgi:peptidoglycan/LPS O-acetylase OafA/YrhL
VTATDETVAMPVRPAPAPTVPMTRPLEWPPPKPPISAVPYLPGLDGMRAIAVVAVMVYHANSSWLPGGFLGVEVFFVISGYLITLLLIGEHERTGEVKLGQFWLRRARRLLPALFVLLIGVTVYTTLFRDDALGQLRGDVLAALTYVTNWYQIWVGQGYTASGDFAPLRHLWSLAVEEQFYLVWPLVMVGLMRLGRRRLPDLSRYLFLAAIGVTVLMAVLYYDGPIGTPEVTPDAYWLIGERPISKTDTLYLGTITRAGGLLLGAAFAMVWRPMAIMRGPIQHKGRLLDGLALGGLVGLGALCWFIYLIGPDGADPWLFRGGFFVCGLATLAMIAAVTHQRAMAGKLLGNVVLLWIGTRSYGLYLYHWPIFQGIRRVAGNTLTFPEFAVAIAATCVVTELSYRFIETPIRKGSLGRWWKQLRASSDPVPRRVIATAAAAVTAVAVFAGTSLATADLRQNEIEQGQEEGRQATVGFEDVVQGVTTTLPRVATTVEATTTEQPTTPEQPTTTEPSTTIAPETTVLGETTVATTIAPTTLPSETTLAPTTVAPPPTVLPTGPIYAIGDSVMVGAAALLAEQGITVIAQESQQVNASVPYVEQMAASGQFGQAVVIHLGTNGPPSDETLDELFAPLAGIPKVVVLTAYAPHAGWIPETNANLWEAAGRYPNIRIVDWAALAPQCPGDCFWEDGYHIAPDGRRYYTDLIVQALAA